MQIARLKNETDGTWQTNKNSVRTSGDARGSEGAKESLDVNEKQR